MPTNQEVMSGILKAIHDNDPNAISSLLEGISSEQRAELCTESFTEYPGLTPLMALTVMTGTLGIIPLQALLKDVSIEKRLEGMQATIPTISNREPSRLADSLAQYQGRNITTLLAKKLGRDLQIIEAFVEGFSDDNDKRKIMMPIKLEYINLLDEIMQEDKEESRQFQAQQVQQPQSSATSYISLPLRRFASQSTAGFTTSAEYTDLFKNINIALPDDKRICLITEVAPDGIGDLVHQMRVFQVLDQLYPGRVDCYTYCQDKHLATVNRLAAENKFTTQINSNPNQIDDPNKYALAVNVSYQQRCTLKKVNTYTLNEIGTSEPAPYQATKVESMGLMPKGVGMWYDNIPIPANRAAVLYHSSELNQAFGCEGLSQPEIENWLDNTWISQSFQYSKDSFVMILFAQLEYIQNNNLAIEHVFIKFFGKDRDNTPWDIESIIKNDKYKEAFSKLNVKSIVLNDKTYMINENNAIELRMSNKRISPESYPAFQQIINGVIIPAGDNSYSEAFSNRNTMLPPYLEVRAAKKSLISSLRYVLQTIPLKDHERAWLESLIKQNETTFLHEQSSGPKSNRDLLEEAHQLSAVWSDIDSPHEIWLSVCERLKEYDLTKRLPAIIREQLFFAQHPEMFDKKNVALYSSSSVEATSWYLQQVEATLDTVEKNKTNRIS